MKIAIFTTEFVPYPGGVAKYCWEIAVALTELGHRVTVFPFDQRETKPPPAPFAVEFISRYRNAHPRHIPYLGFVARKIVVSGGYDVILAADYRSIAAIGWIETSAAKVAVLHGSETRSKLFLLLNKLRVYRPMSFFDLIVTNSDFTRQLCLSHHSYLDARKVIANPLGVAKEWFERCSSRPSDFEDGAKSSPLLLISVGRIERRKGLHTSISALGLVPQPMRARIVFRIIGRIVDETYATELRELAARTDADIEFLGSIDAGSLNEYYETADILMHTCVPDGAKVEGFGLVLLEAAAKGLPVVASAVDAIPEVVIPSETGLLVTPGHAEQVAAAICRLAENGMLRHAISMKARSHAASFTWRRHAIQMLDDMAAARLS